MSPAHPVAASLGRILAMVLRFYYLMRRSWPRLLELVYWPSVQLLMWGYIQAFLERETSVYAGAAGLLIAAAWLWDVLYRSQLGFSLAFLEEVWSRNLAHLLVSPLRPAEFVLSLMIVSLIRAAIGLVPASLLAYWIFDFSVYSLGIGLAAFFFNLVLFGWAVGLAVTGVILRYGQGAETLAWGLIVAVAPLAGVYYPASILPDWLEGIALALPPTHVFEGMRTLMREGRFEGDLMLLAALGNCVYLALGALVFHRCLEAARERGTLMSIGE